jgi:hypothetical protein
MEDGIVQLIKNMIRARIFGQVNDTAIDRTNKIAQVMIAGSAQDYFFAFDCFGNSQMGDESRDSVLPTVRVDPINFLDGIHKKG